MGHYRCAGMHALLRRRAVLALTLCCGGALSSATPIGAAATPDLPASAGSAASPARMAAAASALSGGVNIPGLGDSSNLQEADHAIAYARDLHVAVVRADVPWAAMEPESPTAINARALAFTDRLVADAAAAHIRLVMTVAATPCWASAAPAELLRRCVPGHRGSANTWPPRAASDYAAFVAYLAARYGASVAAIEVWNEPDQANEAYFGGTEKAREYARVLRAAYPAIKAANPGVAVLAGSLVGSNGVFLRALYAAGIKGYYDDLSVHFYNLTLASLRSIHEVQLSAGDPKPLWLDEFGWTSCWPRRRIEQEQGCVTAQVQARNLADTLLTLSRTPFVAAAVVYKLQDSPSEDFGLIDAAGAHKLAFGAVVRVLSRPAGSASGVTLALRSRGAGVLASGSGPVGDYMVLEAFRGSLLRYRALFTLDRFNRFSLALPAALGRHGLRVRVYQYWTGTGRGAQKGI